jgi:hypothetical protein
MFEYLNVCVVIQAELIGELVFGNATESGCWNKEE